MGVKANAPLGAPSTEYLGAGAIYFNFGEIDETVIGATKGGSEFTDNAEFRMREADGDYGPVKGAIDLIKMTPQLTVNALKIDKVNLQKFFAGMNLDDADTTYSKLTRMLDLSSSYITNVAFVGQSRSGSDIIVILYDVLGDGALQFAITKDEEIVPGVQFTATFDPATFDKTDASTYPYQIWLQKAAGNTVTFTITTDGTTPIAGATVTFNGTTVASAADGTAVFTNVATGTNVAFKVEKTGYDTYLSAIDVDGTETKTITMTAE